ncbi:MAG: hypothetical protein AB7K67_01015 [Hyphomicrobiaceae bacterium]
MQQFVIRTSGGWTRVVTAEDVMSAMYVVGCAEITAASTTRPAYREMIDTLRWDEIR